MYTSTWEGGKEINHIKPDIAILDMLQAGILLNSLTKAYSICLTYRIYINVGQCCMMMFGLSGYGMTREIIDRNMKLNASQSHVNKAFAPTSLHFSMF